MIVNILRTNTPNIGDLLSAPSLYFAELSDAPRMEVRGFLAHEAGSHEAAREWHRLLRSATGIIVGGGGLLGNDFFDRPLDYLFEHKPSFAKVVVWGAGHNSVTRRDWRDFSQSYDVTRHPFDLMGVRDAGSPYKWVPCVSCMHPALDVHISGQAQHEVALYAHHDDAQWKQEILANLSPGTPVLDNDAEFDEVLSFISATDLLLTNSFHGVYWATLLGRRVIAFPSSSKFYSLKHPVPLCDPSDWRRFTRMATRYPEAIEECRAANKAYAREVLEFLADGRAS